MSETKTKTRTQIFTVEYIDWDMAMDMGRKYIAPAFVEAYADIELAKVAIAAEFQSVTRENHEDMDDEGEDNMADYEFTADQVVFTSDDEFGRPAMRVMAHGPSNLSAYVHAVDLVTE